MLQTLVLNTASIPISIVPYKRILNRVHNGSAHVVKSYEGTWIKSAGFDVSMFSSGFERCSSASCIEMPIPSVIQCMHTNYIPQFTNVLPFTRKNLYIRDRGRCAYCLKKLSLQSLSFDHVIPRCLGGKTCWDNIVLACFRCNAKKGARHPDQYKWPQLRPYTPKLSQAAPAQLVSKIASEVVEKTWEDFVYWEIILEN
jgi:5-methylcytosine-specific restriction endonuclease McrA